MRFLVMGLAVVEEVWVIERRSGIAISMGRDGALDAALGTRRNLGKVHGAGSWRSRLLGTRRAGGYRWGSHCDVCGAGCVTWNGESNLSKDAVQMRGDSQQRTIHERETEKVRQPGRIEGCVKRS